MLSGCAHKVFDVSSHPYFSNYSGNTLSTQRDAKLCLNIDDKNHFTFRRVKLVSASEWCSFEELAIIPAGSTVYVEGVKEYWVPFRGSHWVALGVVTIAGQTYKFEFIYGYFSIIRAPWENDEEPISKAVPKQSDRKSVV